MHLVGAEPDEVTHTKTMSVVGPDMELARGHQGKDSYVYCRQVPGNLIGVEASEGGGSWRDGHDRGGPLASTCKIPELATPISRSKPRYCQDAHLLTIACVRQQPTYPSPTATSSAASQYTPAHDMAELTNVASGLAYHDRRQGHPP